jgi:tRNA (guanine-N7-)-methyltransferase
LTELSSPERRDRAPQPAASRRGNRSYVLRQGRLTRGQELAIERYGPLFSIPFSRQRLDLAAAFGRTAPLILDIGSGMGETTVAIAAAHPENDFLAVEVHRPGVGSLLRLMAERGLTNIRVIQHDVVDVLRWQIPGECLEAAYLFFPDPWPKKRHHKRRLVNTRFLELLVPKLMAHGRVFLATDWEDHAMHLLEVCDAFPGIENLAGKGQFAPRPAWRPPTKFERRGTRQGFATFDLVYARARVQRSVRAESA